MNGNGKMNLNLRLALLWGVLLILAGCDNTGQDKNRTDQEEKTSAVESRAQAGQAQAQYKLGQMYADGQGVPQDGVQAVKWLKKAAEQGHVKAMVTLGILYDNNFFSDPAESRKWFQKAADAGDAQAARTLAQMDGDETVFEKNLSVKEGAKRTAEFSEAAKETLKAAEMGDVRSQVKLGAMYESEDEFWFSKDDSKAFIWFSVAALSGDKEGATLRDAVQKKLPPEAVMTLEKKAEEIYREIKARKRGTKTTAS